MMRELGVPPEEITQFYQRVLASKGYADARAVVEEYFPLES